jgi:hypothetical protein
MITTWVLTLVAVTLEVGPGRALTRPSQAAAIAQDGDVVAIDAGTYTGDVATWRANGLTLRGVGGRAHLVANGQSAQGKAIWVIQGNNTTVEAIEFSGAAVPDRNGAGIRQEGAGLTVRDCSFHDNENGILAGDSASSDILVERTEFRANGAGDGQSHNMYINRVRSFTLRASHTHDARVGHNIKSRALTTVVEGNRITSEDGGNPSYELEFPNGGTVLVLGNVVHQGPRADNSTLVSFAAEGATNPQQGLFIAYNSFVDGLGRGTFVRNLSSAPAVVVNNVFVGGGPILAGPGTPAGNLELDPGFVDLAGLDLHLRAGAAAIGAARPAGMGGGRSLVPTLEYAAGPGSIPRTSGNDVGAFESTTQRPPPLDAGTIAADAQPVGLDAATPNEDAAASAPDAARATDDAAPAAPDAAQPILDAGASRADGAVSRVDAGGGTTGRVGGSCATTTPSLGWVLVTLALLIRRVGAARSTR